MRAPPTRISLSFSLVLVFLSLAPTARGAAGEATTAEPSRAATCGNGLLDSGESCASCPSDCTVETCQAGKKQAAFEVRLDTPPARKPVAAGIRLAYRGSLLALPAAGGDAKVRQRVTKTPEGALAAANNLGYALRVVVSKSGGFPPGRLFRIAFDLCEGGKEVRTSDVACAVEGCASAAGPIEGCTCRVEKQ